MIKINRVLAPMFALYLACAGPARADEGMWLLNQPPLKILKDKYGFEPDAKWLEHLQKSCVRFSSGGSGSIVSADGLVMTNHHVVSDHLVSMSSPPPGRDLMREGFYAASREQELKCDNLELTALQTIEDVTERINSAVQAEMSAAKANEARQKMIAQVEDEAAGRTGLDCEVVTLWQGARYHLYCNQRYTDVRLVFAPEDAIAFFGGDADNFEYPRFDLDVAFVRIYENGQPLKAEHFLHWSADGGKENDLALVGGHPYSTQRLNTVDHLRFLRDVEMPANLHNLWRREIQAQTFLGRSDDHARMGMADLLNAQNSRKAITGTWHGLLDRAVFRTKVDAEQKLRAAVEANSKWRDQWGDAWTTIAAAQEKHKEMFEHYSALEGRRRAFRSDLFTIARHICELAAERPKPSGERLKEYRDSELDSLYLELYSEAPIHDDLEIDRLANGLAVLAETFGADHHVVEPLLAVYSPRALAEKMVRETKLKDVAVRKQLVEGGEAAILESRDPLILLAIHLSTFWRPLRQQLEKDVESAELDGYAKVAAAQFALYGEDLYPDATFTLRLAFGPIKGYVEDEKPVPPFTTLGGAFERMAQRGGVEPFKLTDRWLQRKDQINLETPFNFVCTADIIGGNSGSPVVNTKGEVIGLIFDGNIQSLIADIAYTEEQARAVAVDARAIIECLIKLYDAGELADELGARAAVQSVP